MRIIECKQLDDAWWAARCGVPSASNFGRIMTSKGKISDGADAYIAELIAERRCQLPNYFSGAGKPSTDAMRRGQDLEPAARAWYEQQVGRKVYTVGFCTTDDGRFGCSPDFLLGDDTVGEIKIYSDELHAKWIKSESAPAQFLQQIHGQIHICERPKHDLVLWSETLPCKIIRTVPNETTRSLRVALEVFSARYLKALSEGEM